MFFLPYRDASVTRKRRRPPDLRPQCPVPRPEKGVLEGAPVLKVLNVLKRRGRGAERRRTLLPLVGEKGNWSPLAEIVAPPAWQARRWR